MIRLSSCPKHYTADQDKVMTPGETVARVKARLAELETQILAETRRIDTGRLDIPVFLSVCGADARKFMPTRKQMGKGASVEQAEASALMELMERYSYWTFWERKPDMVRCTWTEAATRFGDKLIGMDVILQSVSESLPHDKAARVMDLTEWWFCPATDVHTGEERIIPLDWFRKLGEFNGSSAGNTDEESIFQGACELVERHVCCVIDRAGKPVPTISPASFTDPVLVNLYSKFTDNGIVVILKDFSQGMPVPTVAAIAWDPATFPYQSEIVYTAGTASSPVKAAVRALTEVAQLAGDFESGACYEASGLPKYARTEELGWLLDGPQVNLDELPTVENGDIYEELMALVRGLQTQGYSLFSIQTTNPELNVSANYNIVPGFQFRERDKNASLGLFVGRILSEECDAPTAARGLSALEDIYPNAHFLPFFKGMLALRAEAFDEACTFFEQAEPLQPEADAQGLAAFYSGYCHTLKEDWQAALSGLDRAVALCPEMKEYFNFRGVTRFKLGMYAEAADDFRTLIKDLDKGSAIDLANLGLCCKFLDQRAEAEEYLTAALDIDPSIEFARTHLNELRGE
ncbi:YcaO-like family protein [Desulfovibrio mangrovi]|uniref:YcaO-like family protein n=1 Tax=Desulfovibrio mangrovi TaxID=2976983 RepID=UPI00224808F3|nr:YcaO-like family protein [Desulfovibrio mangrovi]UZP67993.1 YcaO-like family protein [Desulfovibrio mangrovi]